MELGDKQHLQHYKRYNNKLSTQQRYPRNYFK